MHRSIWILLLAAACQPTLLPPDALEGTQGRLFDEDTAAARELAETLATDHLDTHAERFFAGLPGGLAIPRSVRIDRGQAHVRLDQAVDGVPVFGAQSIVHLGPDGAVTALTDGWARELRVDTTPSVAVADAIALVEDREGPSISDPEADLFVMRHKGIDRLVWRVRLTQLDGTARSSIPVVFVDAHSRQVVRRYDDLQTTSTNLVGDYNGTVTVDVEQVGSLWHLRSDDVGTYDLGGQAPGWISSSVLDDITATSSTGFTDGVAIDAHYGASRTLAYYDEVHGRNGIDGFGGPHLTDGVTVSAVHYGDNYVNAFWNGSTMVYGDGNGWQAGPLTSLDIAAHEMTHGITQHTAGLIYDGESGALNEAMSDIFAALVEHHEGRSTDEIWKIGEDCWTPSTSGDALRYMDDPTKDWSSKDHYSTRYVGTADNGGVHWNSGIANLAFHLLVEGGTHPTASKSLGVVDGIGFEPAGAIFYEALANHMGPSTDFFGARAATLAAAADLYGEDSGAWISVANAWAEVGVGERAEPLPDNTDPVDPVEPDPVETELAVLLDDSSLASAKDEQVDANFEVPEGATSLSVRLSGGTGDADLYVRHGDAPDLQTYDCRPYKGGNEELCTFDAPASGTWHVAVIGYSAFDGVSLQAEAIVPAAVPEPSHGSLDKAIDASKGDELFYALDVGPGAERLVVTLSGGSGDGDLYVKQGTTVSQSEWDCRPYRGGNEETCTFDAPAEGTWSVMVHGWADVAGATLTAVVE